MRKAGLLIQNIVLVAAYRLGNHGAEELHSAFQRYILWMFVLCWMLQGLNPGFAEELKKPQSNPTTKNQKVFH